MVIRATRRVNPARARAADALQLGAVLVCCEEQPHGEIFACLDARRREAARREGCSLSPD